MLAALIRAALTGLATWACATWNTPLAIGLIATTVVSAIASARYSLERRR